MNSLNMDIAITNFGKRVKMLRKILAINQKDFAKLFGVSASNLSDVEAGNIKPRFDLMVKIAKKYNVNPSWLFWGEGEVFVKDTVEDVLGEFFFGDQTERVRELLVLFKKSPMVKMSIMGYAAKFLLRNESIIEKDIQQQKERDEQAGKKAGNHE